MGHVILGLLLIAPQSQYDLVKSFEAGVMLFYSSSSGSIRRALDRLLAQELIEVDEVGPRARTVYRVTDTGRAEFHAWMTGPPTGPDAEAAALHRLFFLGLLEPADRERVLGRVTHRIETDLDQFLRLDAQLDGEEVPPGYDDVAASQRATLDYGIAALRFALQWFRDYADRQAGD
jgi:DNA-binding PadR family transcriptional regulator